MWTTDADYIKFAGYVWLPKIQGLSGGSSITGADSKPVCIIGAGSSGTETWKWAFALPARPK